MAIGKKSIVKQLRVFKEGHEHLFKVQADKLHRICDIQPRIGNVLSDFQGCPIENSLEQLTNVLHENI